MKAQVTTALVKRRTVTITLDEDEVEDVLSMLSRCSGSVSIALFNTLNDALVADRDEDEREEGEDVPF